MLQQTSDFQPVVKRAVCDYSVRGTDLFSLELWLSNNKWQQPTQQ